MTLRHRDDLPQLHGGTFLTDGGLETELIFHDGIELPAFAAFTLLQDAAGTARLRRYYERYCTLAQERRLGLVLESPTWRASARWGREIGVGDEALARVNRDAVALLVSVREACQGPGSVVISGCVGPLDDAYRPGMMLMADDAQAYHATQITTFADTAADLVTAMTLTYAEEAIGIARAAVHAGIPSVLGFTLETDGRLPSGQALGEAIAQVDDATASAPAYYMVNCAHPSHFAGALEEGDASLARVRALRANASTLSHAELDEAQVLDDGDPADLAAQYLTLRSVLPNLNVVGGCCGTDHRHVEAIRDAWLAA